MNEMDRDDHNQAQVEAAMSTQTHVMARHLIGADGTLSPVEDPGKRGFTLAELHKMVDARMVEIVDLPLAPGWIMVVDEDGWLKRGATINEVATQVAGSCGRGVGLTGNVLVCKRSDIK